MRLPEEFVWGAASSSYQVEGAYSVDGKGISIWDMMCRVPGTIKDGNTGDIACDHYVRFKEDVSLMAELGLKAYRFSISWPRVLPEGTGSVNTKGLDFYDCLVDELLKRNIEPYITLYHWDLPYELHKKGGWLNSSSSDWFSEYTRIVVEKLSDRVKNWITVNEPQFLAFLGYKTGELAPGLKLGMHDVLLVAHNVFIAHGKAVKTIRQYSKQPCRVGFAPAASVSIPVDRSNKNDIDAARESFFSLSEKHNPISLAWWMDPVFFGRYPEDALKENEKDMPYIGQDDMKIISEPIDFLGINIYSGYPVKANEDMKPISVPRKEGYPKTAFNWAVAPESLYWGPKFLYERYKKPIIITENGLSSIDWIHLDGKVHDPQRIDFTSRYLLELGKTIAEGTDVRGYFHWSLMDNFEWAHGFNERFGLIHVDYETQKRTVKDSGYWYKKVIESNGGILKK